MGRNEREASGKKVEHFFTTGLSLFNILIKNGCFVLLASHEFH
jgi:hypothetical protein